MTILDRYLLRRFVENFLICFLSLIGLWIVIEFSTNLDEFLRCGRKSGGVGSVVAHYYGYKAIGIFDQLAGMLAMVAAMFTAAWIQRHNELTALMAAGVPRIRVLRPILVAAGVVILLAAVNREVLIPRLRHEISRRPQDLIGDRPQAFDSCCDNETDVVFSGKNAYSDQQRIEAPEFRMPLTLRDYGRQITAENAYYCRPLNGRPGGYRLDNVREPKNLGGRPSLRLNGRPVLITPRDAAWLKPNQCFLVSNLDFDQIYGDAEMRTTMRTLSSTAQMIRDLRNPSQEFDAATRVAIHARIVHPLLDLTLLFLGLPLIVTGESRHMFLAIGLCMAVTSTFVAVTIGMQFLGGHSVMISPALSAWGPLILFVPVATGLAESLWR